MRGFPCLVVVAFTLALQAPAGSQVYKWVDPAGVTHYGSAPPAGARATIVQPAAPGAPGAATPAQDQARRAPGEDPRPAGGEADGAARGAAGAPGPQRAQADRLPRCAFARQQLDVLTLGGPVFRREAQGGRHYLPDEARDGEIARLRAEVTQQCAGLDSDAATRLRWRQVDNFVLCDRARSLLRALDADRSRVSNLEYDQVTRQVDTACAPGRFPPDTGRRGEWFRQYVLPGELRP